MCYERDDVYKNIYYFYLRFAIDILYSYCTVEYSRETDCTVTRTHNTNHGQLTSPPLPPSLNNTEDQQPSLEIERRGSQLQ